MLILGHRGDSTAAPENTLRAFARAIEAGVDGIELDVRASADGVPVIIHDRNVARTTNAEGNVDELPLAEIQRFDAGAGQRLPTLDEALKLIGDRVRLDIEIKQAGIEQRMLDVLAGHQSVRWLASSFDWNVLHTLRRAAPDVELWPLSSTATQQVVEIAKELDSPAVAINHAAITDETAALFRDADLGIVAWTVNEPNEAQRLNALGVTAFCTDDPTRMIAALG